MKINLLKSTYWSYFISGFGWLFYGIFSAFDNIVLNYLGAVFFLIGVVAGMKIQKLSYEKEDEMSQHNMMKAKAATLDFLRIAVCIVLIILMVFSVLSRTFPGIKEIVELNITLVLALIFAVIQFSVGIYYMKYEKDGE